MGNEVFKERGHEGIFDLFLERLILINTSKRVWGKHFKHMEHKTCTKGVMGKGAAHSRT